jgi:quercetin dioxygenase-like cupin family protein
MSYTGETGEATGINRQFNEVSPLKIGATMARFLVPGSLTGGRFGLFHWDVGQGGGTANPHFHRTFSESFYVLAGNVELYNGNEWMKTSPGDFLYVPEGGIHGFRIDPDREASMLILFAPGPPREQYFEELAEIVESGRQLSDEEMTEFLARHDQYMV